MYEMYKLDMRAYGSYARGAIMKTGRYLMEQKEDAMHTDWHRVKALKWKLQKWLFDNRQSKRIKARARQRYKDSKLPPLT